MHTTPASRQPIKMPRLAVLLPLLTALVAMSCHHTAAVTRVHLTHTGGDLTGGRREALQRMVLRSKARAKRLLHSRRRGGVSIPLSPGPLPAHDNPQAEYVAHLAIGTPPQPVQLTFDTGSDLELPHFAPSLSTTSRGVLPCGSPACQHLPRWSCGGGDFWGNGSCVYTYSYGDNSLTNGVIAVDTFSFAAGGRSSAGAAVPDLLYGCGVFNSGLFANNETGIAGFGRGEMSLPSQLKVANFSHCFTSITVTGSSSKPSSLLLDLPANLYRGAHGVVQSTPLVKNPATSPTFYYLSLKGITVGHTRLAVPESVFALTSSGTGGTIIDSGSSLTSFPSQVYRLLLDAFASQTKLPAVATATGGVLAAAGSLCFTVAPGVTPEVPKLVLHFEGATLDLPRENYMFEIQEDAPGREETIIGNFQQQNLHVLYDLANNKLSFVPAQCDKL
ncbi:hypothetical protein HU200_061938 [Digitaria exilis]|uniref:Peptidase A1 domain-containing protein n=1 Tax=Digitaria exilis TaxID=1010633 RepID=A0A835A812_9POAL|nr:hypothetical protein HU200_061938 [Digitaria exilis]